MKGGRRIKPWQHIRGEKSSQIDEEKNSSTSLRLKRHRGGA
jgi:hypothetical protein